MANLRDLVLLLCISSSVAIIFRRPSGTTISEGRAINETCLRLAGEGSCEFYNCFEQRLPCGPRWYMVRLGGYYCNKMHRHRTHFSIAGQHFLNNTQQCMMLLLQDLYRRDSIGCQELENEAISTIAPCFMANAFCDIYTEDASNFSDVFEFIDLFTRGAGRLWQLVASLAARCGQEALRGVASSAGETVIDSLNSFFDNIDISIDNWDI